MISLSWYLCPCIVSSSWLWVGSGFINSFLVNRIWQILWNINFQIRLYKRLWLLPRGISFSVSLNSSFLGKQTIILCAALWRDWFGKELMSTANTRDLPTSMWVSWKVDRPELSFQVRLQPQPMAWMQFIRVLEPEAPS